MCVLRLFIYFFFFFFHFPCRQNGKKKLPSFFGLDGSQERDTTTDKILQYIPAKASSSTSSPLPAAPGVCSHPPQKHSSEEGRWVWGWGLQQLCPKEMPGRDELSPRAGVEGTWGHGDIIMASRWHHGGTTVASGRHHGGTTVASPLTHLCSPSFLCRCEGKAE